MLAPPKPATRRAVGEGFSLSRYYDPAPTVTSVGFTSDPGSDRVYGPWSIIQATLTFDQDVTVRYGESKREAASIELEMNGETKTAYYARTDDNKVIFEYTVRSGDEAPSYLFLSRVPGSGVRGRGSGERETTASSLAGKEESSRKEDNGGQGKDGPAGAIAQGGNGR